MPANDELLADRYELTEVIGIGGMAEVYRAWDTRLRRPVAVKLFAASADLDNTRRFDNEVRILAGLSHPGLVSVYDTGTSDRKPFVVLRLVDGPTLRHRMAEGPLPVDEVRSLGAAVADALAHVHDQGVVHRDVKPSNILLDHDGTPSLADFGLAHSIGSTRLTRTGLIVGTAAYLAPEQVRGSEVGSAADVYALGLVLLECLTGRCEYTGSDAETILSRLHRSPTIPEHLPVDLVWLLTLMTSQSPGDRPTAHQCADVLSSGQTTAVSAIPRPPRRRALLASAAGLLGAIGLGCALVSGPTAAVSDSPGAAEPVVVQQVVPSTAATPEVPAQLVADSSTPPATDQPTHDVVEPAQAPAQQQTPAQQRVPAQQEVQERRTVPEQVGGPGSRQRHGPGKDTKPAPPGPSRKGRH